MPTCIKLHVATSGNVWISENDAWPQDSGTNIIGYLMRLDKSVPTNYRLLGMLQNVGLLLYLHAFCNNTESTVEVATPRLCSRSALKDPCRVLLAMHNNIGPPSLGGWHLFNSSELVSYALANHFAKGGDVCDISNRLLFKHIAWPALAFIPHLNVAACSTLLAILLDPRWYISPNNPDRCSALQSFCGLNSRVIERLASGSTTKHARLAALVLQCWLPGDPLARPANNDDRPGCFLWRTYMSHSNVLNGILRTSQLFINYLRLVWLDAIYSTNSERLFIPEQFFRDDESTAFKKHICEFSYDDNDSII